VTSDDGQIGSAIFDCSRPMSREEGDAGKDYADSGSGSRSTRDCLRSGGARADRYPGSRAVKTDEPLSDYAFPRCELALSSKRCEGRAQLEDSVTRSSTAGKHPANKGI